MHICTCVSRAAFAAVAVGELNTVVRPLGVAGVRQTLVHVALTALSYVARWAHAPVTADAVHALAIIEALGLIGQRVAGGGAVIQVDLTVDTYGRHGALKKKIHILDRQLDFPGVRG